MYVTRYLLSVGPTMLTASFSHSPLGNCAGCKGVLLLNGLLTAQAG